VKGDLDLTLSPAFGTAPALETLRELIGPRPDDQCEAAQAAVASFTRYGFEAAAVTALGIRASAARLPVGRSVQRTAVLRFDHPYAVVAIAGRPASRAGSGSGVGGELREGGEPGVDGTAFSGLPLFSAWVQEPAEPEDDPS
jgi:hypothetical protein